MKSYFKMSIYKLVSAFAVLVSFEAGAQLVDLTTTLTSTPVTNGENFTISINADATGINVDGNQIRITYNQALMSFVSVTVTSNGSDPGSTLSVLNVNSSTPGVLFFATTAPLGSFVTGNFTAGLVTFEATNSTITPTTIDYVVGGLLDTIISEQTTANDVTGTTTGISFTIEETLSVPKNSAGLNFRVFPNPSSDMIEFKIFDAAETMNSFSIVDLNGRVIESKEFQNGPNSYVLDVRKYAKGLYIAKIDTFSGKIGHEKILIE